MLLCDLQSREFEHKSGVTGQTVIDMLSFKVTDLIFEGLAQLAHGCLQVCFISRKLGKK